MVSKIEIKECRFCGSTELIEACQSSGGDVFLEGSH